MISQDDELITLGMNDLAPKPCPFCAGDKLRFEQHRPVAAEPDHTFIVCCTCMVSGPSAKHREAAVRAWNHRPTVYAIEQQYSETIRNLRHTIEQAEASVALWRERANKR